MAHHGTWDEGSAPLELPLEQERHWCFQGFTENVFPALLPVWRDWTRTGRRCVGRESEASRQNPESQHVKRITDQERALQATYLQHPGNCPHRLARGPSFVLDQDRAIRHAVFLRVFSPDSCFAGSVSGAGSTSENQERGKMTVPEFQSVIEPRTQHR